jgi:hypothetical protein
MRLRRRSAREAPAETPANGTTTTAAEGGPAAPAKAAQRDYATAEPTAGRETAREARNGAREPRRRGRARNAAGATAGTIGSGVLTLARLVMALATLIALLIALAIILRDVDANASNSIVKGIHAGANFFAGSFTGLIKFSAAHPKRAITVNWGIAVLAFLLVGVIVSRLIAAVGRSGVRFGRRHRAVPMH